VQVRTVSWLYRIATNCALDELRHRRVIRQIPFADLAVADGDLAFDVVDAQATTFVDRLAEVDAFQQIWQHLTPAERTALIPIRAASEPARATMRRSRARQHLRKLWQEVAA
jgi:DNA-directed RNA polymerase specialized sigma24 family protein